MFWLTVAFLLKLAAIFVFLTLSLVNVPYTIYLVRSVQLTQIYRVRKPILILPGMKSAAQIRLVQPAAGGTATALTTVYRRSTVRNLAGQEAAIGMIATGSKQAQPWSSQVASAGMIAAGNWNSTILVGQEAAIGMIATGSSQVASAAIIAAGSSQGGSAFELSRSSGEWDKSDFLYRRHVSQGLGQSSHHYRNSDEVPDNYEY